MATRFSEDTKLETNKTLWTKHTFAHIIIILLVGTSNFSRLNLKKSKCKVEGENT
jgi:hypothetical protein